MTGIPKGLVDVVARAINDKNPENEMFLPWEDLPGVLRTLYRSQATAAILAQHAWYDEQNRRMSKFVEFQGPNPRG